MRRWGREVASLRTVVWTYELPVALCPSPFPQKEENERARWFHGKGTIRLPLTLKKEHFYENEIRGNTRLSLRVKKSFVFRLYWPLFYLVSS